MFFMELPENLNSEMPTAVSPAPFRAIQLLKTKLYANESSMLAVAVGSPKLLSQGIMEMLSFVKKGMEWE